MGKKDKNRENWIKKVSMVFDRGPRDASSPKNVVWLPRKEKETELLDAIYEPKVHVCIDGPSGTGKSSLAITSLGISETKYVPIQIFRDMSWTDFCRNLVKKPLSTKDNSASASLEFGIESALPVGKFQVSLGHNTHEDNSIEELAKGWKAPDVCRAMVTEGVTLLIDDFEKANEEIVTGVADMAKLLTQTFFGPHSKLIIVGTDDICRRLYQKDKSLDSRIIEISLGGFPSIYFSWKYLLLGFEALNLRHPANSSFENERMGLETCIRSVYDAADGLPKSLTEMGWEITKQSYDRQSVNVSDIKSCSLRIIKKKVQQFRNEFPKLLIELRNNECVRLIIRHFLEEGAGSIFTLSDVLNALNHSKSNQEIDDAIRILVELEILTQTGFNNDIIFFKNLPFAHTLGVISENPQKYGLLPQEFVPLSQLSLPFTGESLLFQSNTGNQDQV